MALPREVHTAGGVIAILIFATYWSVARQCSRAFGAFTSAAIQYALGGTLGTLFLCKRQRDDLRSKAEEKPCSASPDRAVSPRRALSPRDLTASVETGRPAEQALVQPYTEEDLILWTTCGGQCGNSVWYYALAMVPYVCYPIAMMCAYHACVRDEQVLLITICNYTWPEILACYNVLIKKSRVRWTFPIGLLCAFFGVVMATVPAGVQSLDDLFLLYGKAIEEDYPFVLLGLVCAFLWASFSAATQVYLVDDAITAVPLCNLVCGLLLAVTSGFVHEPFEPTTLSVTSLLFTALFPVCLGKMFWENAMRNGNTQVVTTFAFFAPILSSLTSSVVLGVTLTPWFCAGASLVCVGAVLTKCGVGPPRSAQRPAALAMPVRHAKADWQELATLEASSLARAVDVVPAASPGARALWDDLEDLGASGTRSRPPPRAL